MRSFVSGLTAAGLLVASTASASAAPAIPADTRMSSPGAEELSGDSTWLWIAGGVILLLVLFLVVLDDDDEDDLPTSP